MGESDRHVVARVWEGEAGRLVEYSAGVAWGRRSCLLLGLDSGGNSPALPPKQSSRLKRGWSFQPTTGKPTQPRLWNVQGG